MADWGLPLITSLYTNFLAYLKARDEDCATMFDVGTPTSVVTNTVRWSSANNRFEIWDSAAWQPLTSQYAINVLTLGGNSSATLLSRSNHTGTQAPSTIAGVSVSAAQINYTGVATLGVVESSKCVTADASRNISNINQITAVTFNGNAVNVNATVNEATNESNYLAFVDGASGAQGIETDSGLRYNPSTNTITGNINGLASNATQWNGAVQTSSTSAPTGGADGDIHFQYE